MLFALAKRVMTEAQPTVVAKFAYNFGFKGIRSVELHKRRRRRGEYFPPFLFISIISSCQLRCQGCWVDVAAPTQKMSLDELNRIIGDAKKHGNSYFGILGGEPFLHPQLLDIFAAHPDCYFQVFTNGQLITDEVARQLARLGNVTPLISIEGTEIVSDERRGRPNVLTKTLEGLEACRRHGLITGVATSVCQTNMRSGDRSLAAPADRDGRALRLVPHLSRGRTRSPIRQLALRPEQVLAVRRFVVAMRARLPIAIVDAYWDDNGEALCPMATGVSHHIGPGGDIEPCPIIQFATSTDPRRTVHLRDDDQVGVPARFPRGRGRARRAAASCWSGPTSCAIWCGSTARRTRRSAGRRMAEFEAMTPRRSQHNPGNEIPEEHWVYRFAKKHWFFGFGAYTQ